MSPAPAAAGWGHVACCSVVVDADKTSGPRGLCATSLAMTVRVRTPRGGGGGGRSGGFRDGGPAVSMLHRRPRVLCQSATVSLCRGGQLLFSSILRHPRSLRYSSHQRQQSLTPCKPPRCSSLVRDPRGAAAGGPSAPSSKDAKGSARTQGALTQSQRVLVVLRAEAPGAVGLGSCRSPVLT